MKDPDGKPCPNPKCDSTDGYKIKKETGWGHCFVCGINMPPRAANKEKHLEPAQSVSSLSSSFRRLPDHYNALSERGISRASAEKYGIWHEEGCYFFPSFEKGKHVGTKMRNAGKKFKWSGKQGELFGQHLFEPGSAKQITVVEGEFDAAAAFELLGSRFPVVSVVNGCGTAERDVKANWEYLNSFDQIVFAFDGDDAGADAATKCGQLFPAGKVRILRVKKHKDANEYLKAGDAQAYTKEWWGAPTLMMDGLKIGSNMWEEITNRPSHFSTPYPFPMLNRLTYGIRLSEFIVINAPTGVGKTSLLKEIEYELLNNAEIKEKNYGVGFMHLEEPNYDTALGLMSIHKNKPYHLPDTPKPIEELKEAYDATVNSERVVIWDHFGSNSIDSVLAKVRHMAALGCKYIVLDHLSIVVSDQSGDERKQLDEISTKLKTLCMELNIALIAVIHQNRQGQIRGTAGVEQLANIILRLERDMIAADPWRRNVTKVTVDKNRFCGRTGPGVYLWYNEITGRMVELNDEEIAKYEAGGTVRDDELPF